MATKDVDLEGMNVLAWVGPDENDGSRGIKSAETRVGWVPLAFKGEHRDRADSLREQLQRQADLFGTRIRLARFALAEVLDEIEPCPDPADVPGGLECPAGCGLRLDESDHISQRIHLTRNHLDFVKERQAESARWDAWVVD